MCLECTAQAFEGAPPFLQKSKGRGRTLGTFARYLKLHRVNPHLKEEFFTYLWNSNTKFHLTKGFMMLGLPHYNRLPGIIYIAIWV